jgi:hypothetical protein
MMISTLDLSDCFVGADEKQRIQVRDVALVKSPASTKNPYGCSNKAEIAHGELVTYDDITCKDSADLCSIIEAPPAELSSLRI